MIIKDIPLSEIEVIDNIRQVDQNIPELMQSIKDYGLMQPIGLKETNEKYRLLWGSRRFIACKKLGFKTIPAVIFSTKDEEMSEEQFFLINATENMQRRENNLKEFGRVCKILRKTMSPSEIGKRLGVPKSRVERAINEVGRIPIKWQSKIRIFGGEREKEGDIPLGTASKIASFRNLTGKQKDELLENVSKNDEGYIRTTYIASIMRTGKSFKEAKKLLDSYKLVEFKFLLKKDIFEKEIEGYSNPVDWVIDTFNKKVNDNGFAIKTSYLFNRQKEIN